MSHWFACEIEESVFQSGTRSPVESKRDRGFARAAGSFDEGFEIEASSDPVDEICADLGRALALPQPPDLSRLPDNITARVLARASSSTCGDGIRAATVCVITLTTGEYRVIATPDSLAADARFVSDLARRASPEGVICATVPVAWMNGSGAVLLHEAIGHPAERGLFANDLPAWLGVEDDPGSRSLVRLAFDDTASPVGRSSLTRGERPSAVRRWSHRDVPMRRLTNLVARGSGSPLSRLPSPRIEALLAGHGYWDAPTDEIAVHVSAADLVDGSRRTPIAPFVFRASRSTVPRMLAGWFGKVTRHPGVLCGDEGVTLPVGSASVGLLTRART